MYKEVEGFEELGVRGYLNKAVCPQCKALNYTAHWHGQVVKSDYCRHFVDVRLSPAGEWFYLFSERAMSDLMTFDM